MIVADGRQWVPVFDSVDEALDTSINRDGPAAVIQIATETLDDLEALLLLARHAKDYERTDHACQVLAGYISPVLGHDEGLVYDILRELAGLTVRFRYAQHMRRIEATRADLAQLKRKTIEWAAATEQRAESLLEEALQDAGFLQG